MGGAYICRSCDPAVKAEIEKIREAGKPVNAIHVAKKIFKETNKGGEYLLRDIPDGLWKEVKIRSAEDNDSYRDIILKALYSYIDKDKKEV